MTASDTDGGSMKESSQPHGSDRDKTFEDLMEELESLTARLAAGDVGIEATADLYEQAEAVHAQARQRLDQVRARVERLAGGIPPVPDGYASSLLGGDEIGEPAGDGAP